MESATLPEKTKHTTGVGVYLSLIERGRGWVKVGAYFKTFSAFRMALSRGGR